MYNFEGENDFEHFVRLAEEENLLVILRTGPYICAERDFVSLTLITHKGLPLLY